MLQVIRDERPFNLATLLGHILAQKKSITFHVQELKNGGEKHLSLFFWFVFYIKFITHKVTQKQASIHYKEDCHRAEQVALREIHQLALASTISTQENEKRFKQRC